MLRSLRHLTGKAISQYSMINEGDKILIAVSGGKDSMLLAQLLFDIQRRAPINFELLVGTIDPGFKSMNMRLLKEYYLSQKWPHAFSNINVAQIMQEKQTENTPCSLCARLRRGKLHNLADTHSCNKIALGHHLDDICVSFLLSIFRGQGTATMGPNVAGDNNTKRIIRPLAFIEEATIKTAISTGDLPNIGVCPYETELHNSGDRAFLEKELTNLNQKFPNIRRNMLRSLQELRPQYLLDKNFLSLS